MLSISEFLVGTMLLLEPHHVDRLSLEGEAAVEGDDEQERIAQRCGDHVFCGPVGGRTSCSGSLLIFVRGQEPR
jgi:hypothetical protein